MEEVDMVSGPDPAFAASPSSLSSQSRPSGLQSGVGSDLIDVERAVAAVLVDFGLGELRPRMEAAHDVLRRIIGVVEALEQKAATLPSEVARAYGLLWQMEVDRNDPNLRYASDARQALLSVLSDDERSTGIAWTSMDVGREEVAPGGGWPIRTPRAATVFCAICGGEFDAAEWAASASCPECEEPKQ